MTNPTDMTNITPPNPPASPAGLDTLLTSRGYVVFYREAPTGITTVTLRRGHERWQGWADSRAGALDDALAQALPSALGRSLLRDRQRADGQDATAPVDEAAAAPATTAVMAPAASAAIEPAIEAAATERAVAEPAAAEPITVAEPVTVAEPSVAKPAEVAPTKAEPAAVESSPPWPDGPTTTWQAEQETTALLDTLRDELPELAGATPAEQRLQITAAIAWIRALSQRFPNVSGVSDAEQRLARGCARLVKRWWPGQITILSLSSTPATVGRSLDAASASTWVNIAELAEGLLVGEGSLPRDFGPLDWCDDDAGGAEASDPEATLRAAHAAVAAVLGPLNADPPSWRQVGDELPLNAEAWQNLARAAAQLRWLREELCADRRWVEAMGRLRWLTYHRKNASDKLLRAIDPAYAPSGGWAKLLGHDSSSRGRRKRALRELLRDFKSAQADRSSLLVWLDRAMEMDGELLSVSRLTGLLSGHAQVVFSISDKELSKGDERGIRRRFKKLKGSLKTHGGALADPAGALARLLAETGTDDAEPTDEISGERSDIPQDTRQDTPPEQLVRRPKIRLGRAIHAKFATQRALIISNRIDHRVREELTALTGMRIESAVAEPRRVDSISAAISGGRYQVIIAVTGFIGHKTEQQLRKAMRGGDALYVRAYKGRTLSCLRAIARESGLEDAA